MQTGTKIPYLTPPREQLLQDVVTQYANAETGAINWGKVWEDHPDWKPQLVPRKNGRPHMQPLYNGVSDIKRRMKSGRIQLDAAALATAASMNRSTATLTPSAVEPSSPAPEPAAPEPANDKSKPWKLWTDEHKQIARELAKDPQWHSATGKGLAWRKIFKAHPELAPKFECPDPANISAKEINRVSSFSTRLLQLDRKVRKLKRSPESTEEQPAPRPADLGCKFCPECGYNLRMHNAAHAVAIKHTRSNGTI